jgi:hypothetical protein
MRITELELSGAALACLDLGSITDVDQLLAHSGTVLAHCPYIGAMELYEIVCQLNRHNLSLPMFPGFQPDVPNEREREMFRLRLVEGLPLTEIGQRLAVAPEWVRHVLHWHFGLTGKPPAVKARKRQRKRERQERE